jgi:hypothetical protein
MLTEGRGNANRVCPDRNQMGVIEGAGHLGDGGIKGPITLLTAITLAVAAEVACVRVLPTAGRLVKAGNWMI